MKRIFALLVAFMMTTLMAFAARTAITAVTPKSVNAGTISVNAADVTFTACTGSSGSDGNYFTASGKDLVMVYNSHGTTAYTCTFTSVADGLGRTGDVISYSLAAGEYALFGPFGQQGWMQTNSQVYFEGNNAAIKFLVIKAP